MGLPPCRFLHETKKRSLGTKDVKVTRTDPPQSDPNFYAKVMEENKQLKNIIEQDEKVRILAFNEIKQLKEQLTKTEKSLDNHMAYISKLKI